MVGRIVRAADFERVLATAPRSRSAHFAVHHLAARPLPTAGSAKRADAKQLSTGDAPACPPPVDESPGDWWLGMVVPKRHARRAVTRSLLKRQMRAQMLAAVTRADPATRPAPGLWVLRLKAPFDPATYPSAASAALRVAARDELLALLARTAR